MNEFGLKLGKTGPEVPAEVLRAHEDGRLVFFCGAGVSAPGLPLFKGLVDEVFSALHVEKTESEKFEDAKENYDRVLDSLERRTAPGAMRGAVRQILSVQPTDENLGLHRSLIDLARQSDNSLRLVTTNFDNYFELASGVTDVDRAPKLPVPKPNKWSNLVHLHGAIESSDPGGATLVLTSSDFGVAYLTEAWAARFVTELFRHFTVLFVGYSDSDPVMRYLVDAIAADRRRSDQNLGSAFALVGCRADEVNRVEKEWQAKQIIPIHYDSTNGHENLHLGLASWASLWRDGLRSRANLVARLGSLDPSSLDEAEVSQICWALREPSGSMMREFYRYARVRADAWLQILSQNGLLDSLLIKEAEATEIGARMFQSALCAWFAEHIDNEQFAAWAIDHSEELAPALKSSVRGRLEKIPAPEFLNSVWAMLCGPYGGRPISPELAFSVRNRLEKGEWSHTTRVELLFLLRPRLKLSVSRMFDFEHAEQFEASYGEKLQLRHMVHVDVELFAGEASWDLFASVKGHPRRSEILCDIGFEVSGLLRSCLDLFQAFQKADRDEDLSSVHRPSVADHEQNQDFFSQWVMLIALARDCFSEMDRTGKARVLLKYWEDQPFLSFRRLRLHAASTSSVLNREEADRLLLENLWESQPETYSLLTKLAGEPALDGSTSIQDAIVDGPARGLFRRDLTDEEFERRCDWLVWKRLAHLERTGVQLSERASQRLLELQGANPKWDLGAGDRYQFSSWIASGVGRDTDFTTQQLLALHGGLIDKLLAYESNREGLLEQFRDLFERDPRAGTASLVLLARRGQFKADVWEAGLSGIRVVKRPVEVRRILWVISRLPSPVLVANARSLAWAIESFSGINEPELESNILATWDFLFDPLMSVKPTRRTDSVASFFDSPARGLSDSLMKLLFRSATTGGIPNEYLSRLDRLVGAGGPEHHGRAALAYQFARLQLLDESWVASSLTPSFSWANPDGAERVWEGFLSNPRLTPLAWDSLAPFVTEAAERMGRREFFGEQLGKLLGHQLLTTAQPLLSKDSRRFLRSLSLPGRIDCLSVFLTALENAGAKAANLWGERIGPWVEVNWPIEVDFREPKSSALLAQIAIASGDAFPEAVLLITTRLGESDQQSSRVVSELNDKTSPSKFPTESLMLLNAIVPQAPRYGVWGLKKAMEQIEGSADPATKLALAYRRLSDLVVRFPV